VRRPLSDAGHSFDGGGRRPSNRTGRTRIPESLPEIVVALLLGNSDEGLNVTPPLANPHLGGPLPGPTTCCQAKPCAFNRLRHSGNRMDERAERVPLEPANGILGGNRRADVPKISRIRIGEVTLRVFECFVQKRLKRWVAANDTIHGHDGCRRNRRADIKEIAVSELYGSKLVAACRFLSGRSEVGG